MRRVIAGFSAIAALTATAMHGADELPVPKARQVVLCVWDGMRPDFISPTLTPNLHALAERGTFFSNNHAFYPTTTQVNGAVLATGAFPSRSGITANFEYRPVVHMLKAVSTDDRHTMRVLDTLTGGRFLTAPTLAERVQRAGHRTIVAGTKGVVLLQDRTPQNAGRNGSVTLFGGQTHPESVLSALTRTIGPFPEYPDTTKLTQAITSKPHNVWTTRALTEVLWKDSVPPYTVLWLSDPDYSQHFTAPGTEVARTAIFESDANFGTVIETLKRLDLLDSTDILVVSDHGFSTVGRVVDLLEYFKQAGIKATREFKLTPESGEVLINNLAGSTGLYVIGHDQRIVQKIVDVLHASDFAGPIFTRTGLPGTFKLADAHLESADAPDVLFSFRWDDRMSIYGARGAIIAEGKQPGFGTHGTLSKYDIRNTLVVAGPDFRSGFRSPFPSGNIDLAQTILHLLKIPPQPGESQGDGRVLVEALVDAKELEDKPMTRRIEVTRDLPSGKWTQYLQTTTYAEKTYLDEGNAETLPR